jgi:eukaryotic-like serine/threonine-protein kinase
MRSALQPATIPHQLADVLSKRYSIERELGRGGMSIVYLAHDVYNRRQVAIKVMRPEVGNALGAERFDREIAIARSMTHPLIVPLYESGCAGGLLYYVMRYVEGESLFDRLQRERQLSVEGALRIIHDLAAALGYAHSRGVLHRDVKPENVLLADGRALIADFGLARAIGAADYRRLTQTGLIVGTAFYLTPEQLRGEHDLDQRVDVYGLGCLLYEMLTGEPPYTGRSLMELATRIIRAPIPSANRPERRVPLAVDQAISRALAKSAADRFSSMDAFTTALPRPAAATAP